MSPIDKATSSKASSSKPGLVKSYRGVPRAKSGCYTCRIRRKKCDEQPDEEGRCATCVRLRLECLGFGAKRPEWLRDNRNVAEVREKIKVFLASQGMVKGYSGATHQGFSFQDQQQYYPDHPDNGQSSQVEPSSYHPHSHTPMTRSPTPVTHENSPHSSSHKLISFGRGTQHLLNQDAMPGSPAYPLYPVGNAWGREGHQTAPDYTSDVSDSEKIEDLTAKLETIFDNKEEYNILLSCKGAAAQRLLDMLQRLLDIANDPRSRFQQHLIVTAQELAENSGLYPTCYELNGVASRDFPDFPGGSADIYRANFRGRDVCVKTLRLDRTVDVERILKVISREGIRWGQLRHPNVLPFYGIYRFRNHISFVAPWMDNGDLIQFLKTHQDQSSNRVVYALDVAQGLKFLHQNEIIHGGLKGANVLINEFGRACIGGLGLYSVADRDVLQHAPYALRWQAPELLNAEGDEQIRNTQASDIYAWACVAYEIFTGQLPFAHVARDAAVILRVARGEQPRPPPESSPSWGVWGLTQDIWSLMQTCWDADPSRRPAIGLITGHLVTNLPRDVEMDLRNTWFPPGQFREMTRRGFDETELSVDFLESLISTI